MLVFVLFSGCRNTSKPRKNHELPQKEKTIVETNQLSNRHIAPGGTYSFERPKDFALAVKNEQILEKSYIPPCKSGFEYCLYYTGNNYKNTNFESAGVGFYVLKNIGKTDCFAADKYNGRKENLHNETIQGIPFTVFTSGDAAMGHYANDVVFRTFQHGKCYQFVARIGTSQFKNYPPGSIKKFTPVMEKKVMNALRNIIQEINFNTK